MDLQKFQQQQAMILAGGMHRLRFRDLFILSLRVFRVRPLRTFLTIFGISLGIGTVLFLVSLGYGLQYILIGKLAATEDSLISLETFYPTESSLNISTQNLDEILALSGVEEISPVGEFTAEVKTGATSTPAFLTVKIVKPNYFRLSGLKPDVGSDFTENEKSAVVSNTALQLFNIKEPVSPLGAGLTMRIFYQDEKNPETGELKIIETLYPLKIVGVITDEFSPPYVLVPTDSLKEPPPFYQRVFVKAKDIDSVNSLRDSLIEKGFFISARIDLVNQARRIMTVITVILGIFGVTALLVSAIGMFNTMVIGFLERIFEVGIMKSLGATVADIRNLFLMESLIMGVLGGVGGIAVGVLSGQLFNLGLNFLAKTLGGKPVQLFIYPWEFLAFIIGISALVGIVSGFWPARRAAQLSPKQAFKNK